jgi:hypothetical protein
MTCVCVYSSFVLADRPVAYCSEYPVRCRVMYLALRWIRSCLYMSEPYVGYVVLDVEFSICVV